MCIRDSIKAKLRGQGATTAEMLRSVVASFGFEPSQISVIEHPAEYQFEIVLSDLASVPSDVGGIEAAVNEIDRKSTRLNSSHITRSRMPSSA